MYQLIGIAVGLFLGGKIGNEIFRFKNPESSYKPPPFFSFSLNTPLR